jgi:hypothetical protein
MNIKNVLFASILASCMATGTNASQGYEETSSVAKYCHKGRCFLSHFYKETNGANVYLSTKSYDLKHNTPIVIKDKERNISIISGEEFEKNKELHNYFLTQCFSEFYVLEEKADDDASDYSCVNCSDFYDMVSRYQDK